VVEVIIPRVLNPTDYAGLLCLRGVKTGVIASVGQTVTPIVCKAKTMPVAQSFVDPERLILKAGVAYGSLEIVVREAGTAGGDGMPEATRAEVWFIRLEGMMLPGN
jgi:hypothetical protein